MLFQLLYYIEFVGKKLGEKCGILQLFLYFFVEYYYNYGNRGY